MQNFIFIFSLLKIIDYFLYFVKKSAQMKTVCDSVMNIHR